jgi:ribosomal protein L37AE/L43A
MADVEQKKKKRKQQQKIVLQTEEISQSGQDLIKFMQELEADKKYLDIQICPKCKSPKVKRVGAQDGDSLGNMALTPPKYRCSECGWTGQTKVKTTNRPLSVRDVEIIAEALDLAGE